MLLNLFPETGARRTSSCWQRQIYSPVWEDAAIRELSYFIIPDGSKKYCLATLAGMLPQPLDIPKGQIYEELLYCNTVACDPPLGKSELKNAYRSVRYKDNTNRIIKSFKQD